FVAAAKKAWTAGTTPAMTNSGNLNENPATAAGSAHCGDDGFSGPDCQDAGAGRHAAVRSAPGRPAWHVSGGTRHWPDSSDHGSDRTVAGRPDASPVPGCSEYSLRPEQAARPSPPCENAPSLSATPRYWRC